MKEYGVIAVHVKSDFRGNEIQRIYEWKGPPEAKLSWSSLEEIGVSPTDTDFSIGPYHVSVIDSGYDALSDYCLVVRKDYPFWRVVVFGYRLTRWLDIAYRRIILTLAVWRLADYNAALIPSWRDIPILRKIFRR